MLFLKYKILENIAPFLPQHTNKVGVSDALK